MQESFLKKEQPLAEWILKSIAIDEVVQSKKFWCWFQSGLQIKIINRHT